ncbi:MAG TPA: hypothetical protein VML19_06220 [Verrucomicrobiae bacterium]|nr:hypothetical protein [Verrucomicrobiae bacterium]
MRLAACLLAIAAAASWAVDTKPAPPSAATVSGKLIVHEGQAAELQTGDGKTVQLDGDEPTRKVLGDSRLNGFQVEAHGHFTDSGHFLIDPIHTHSFLVRKDGKLKLVTYWCDVCSIRAYTPGPCVCCQRETTLDLRDPDQQ